MDVNTQEFKTLQVAEWPIKDVANSAGVTSRTLRYYEQIGLLNPSRVSEAGYRFYGEKEISRLYRILSLRALELPLVKIRSVLENDISLTDAIVEHLEILKDKKHQIERQIVAVKHVLETTVKGKDMSVEEIFSGIDGNQFEAEVRQRWGDEAWERSVKRRQKMSQTQLVADDERTKEVNEALRNAATEGEDAAGDKFQELIALHHSWVTDQWGGRSPNREAYLGLAEMYVADMRFAATYGGQENAATIREAMHIWATKNLTQ